VQTVYKYAVLGGSNADRLGDAMIAMGKDVVKITKSGWRPSKKGGGGDAEADGGTRSGREDHHPLWYGQRCVLRGG
jgi:hypothetical protein